MAITDFLFKKKEETSKGGDGLVPVETKPVFIPAIPMTGLVQPGKIDYNKHFDEVMKEKNQVGPDYLEFSQALKALDNMPLTEQQKYISTYPTYLSMGVDANKLAKSAEFYLNAISAEKADFAKSLEIARKSDVTEKETIIKERQAAIVMLNKQIQEANDTINRLLVEKQQAEQSLMVEESNFNNVFNQRSALITDHITKIKTYLNAVT